MENVCLVCNENVTDRDVFFEVKELQLGLGSLHKYWLCSNCKTMNLAVIPNDLGKYYPNDNYYSFNVSIDLKKDTLKKIKASYLIFNKNKVLGNLLSIGYKTPDYFEMMKFSKTQYHQKILDVGTGNGNLLTKLHTIGFENLTGIDPFIEKDIQMRGLKVLKKNIFELDECFDTIMLNHSLEHMVNPKEVMAKVYSILNQNGSCILRIPIMGNYGWRKYGLNWCGLDAPRHIFIPSKNGLETLVESVGFTVEKFIYDSTDYVIWCSEQYKQGIYLHHPKSKMMNSEKSLFTKKQIKEFRNTIAIENENNNGDTATIYLRKK